MEGLTKLEEMTPWERHQALCLWARLLAREHHMTHKSVGELIESGQWAGEIVSLDCKFGESPYDPESYLAHTGRRQPGNNIDFDPIEKLRARHKQLMEAVNV